MGETVKREGMDIREKRAPTDCDQVSALIPAHSIGATDPDEAALIERGLGDCPGAARELAAYRDMAGRLAANAPAAEPPARLRDSILAAARRTPQTGPGRQRAARPSARTLLPFAAPHPGGLRLTLGLVAAVAIIFAGALWALSELSRLRATNAWLAERIERQGALIDTFQAADARLLRLPTAANGQETGANALVVWSPGLKQGMLMAEKFPAAGEGKVFQVWLTRGEQITSLGTFPTNAQGAGYLVLPADVLAEPFDALGVTVEPAGGSERPTSKPVVRLEMAQE